MGIFGDIGTVIEGEQEAVLTGFKTIEKDGKRLVIFNWEVLSGEAQGRPIDSIYNVANPGGERIVKAICHTLWPQLDIKTLDDQLVRETLMGTKARIYVTNKVLDSGNEVQNTIVKECLSTTKEEIDLDEDPFKKSGF